MDATWDIVASEAGTAEIWHDGKHVGYITHESTDERTNSNGSTYERRRYLLQGREVRGPGDGIMAPIRLYAAFMGTTVAREVED